MSRVAIFGSRRFKDESFFNNYMSAFHRKQHISSVIMPNMGYEVYTYADRWGVANRILAVRVNNMPHHGERSCVYETIGMDPEYVVVFEHGPDKFLDSIVEHAEEQGCAIVIASWKTLLS